MADFVDEDGSRIRKDESYENNYLIGKYGAIMAFVVLKNIAERMNWKQNKVFSALTRYSMPMYLFHQQIIYFVIVWLNGKANPYINVSVNFAAAVVGSFLISWILMRFKVTRFLIGEKE